jgi:hypothetical protein
LCDGQAEDKATDSMTVTIDPAEFARLMSLPATDRHDLLEFLGSTLAGRIGTAETLRRAVITTSLPARGREKGAVRATDAH